jgi:hypothetical protein
MLRLKQRIDVTCNMCAAYHVVDHLLAVLVKVELQPEVLRRRAQLDLLLNRSSSLFSDSLCPKERSHSNEWQCDLLEYP